MLDIGKLNIFRVVKLGMSVNHLSRTIDYYDLLGKNLIYLNSNVDSEVFLKCSIRKFETNIELVEILKNDLFRVDVILIDYDHRADFNDRVNIIQDVTSIPIIILQDIIPPFNEDCLAVTGSIFDNADYCYNFYSKMRTKLSKTILDIDNRVEYIEDVKNGWVSTYEDINKQLIRDMKIDNILNNKDV